MGAMEAKLNISRIFVENLPESGLDLHSEVNCERFEGLVALHQAGEWRFDEPIRCDLHLKPIDALIHVDGRLSTVVEADCSRCLTPFRMPLNTRCRFTYTKPPDLESGDEPLAEQELTPEEAGLIPYKGDEIDLTGALQEEIIMALPMRPLCSEDCKGLCAQCGADLNQGDCGCRKTVVNPMFEVLKGMKIGKK